VTENAGIHLSFLFFSSYLRRKRSKKLVTNKSLNPDIIHFSCMTKIYFAFFNTLIQRIFQVSFTVIAANVFSCVIVNCLCLFYIYNSFFSVIRFICQIFNMATVRSISPTKPPERLLTRRLTRTSASATPPSQRKVTLSKTTPITVTTIKRRKSSRMSSKKALLPTMPSPARLNSFTNMNNTSDNNEFLLFNRLIQIIIVDNKPNEEPQNDNPISNNMNETLPSSSSSRKSSAENIEFSVDSLDIVRTVGTGKIFN
jgi:hypothetical protein